MPLVAPFFRYHLFENCNKLRSETVPTGPSVTCLSTKSTPRSEAPVRRKGEPAHERLRLYGSCGGST